MEPPSKGHFGTSHFVPCREAVLFQRLKMYCKYTFGNIGSVICREVVPFSESPLLEVPLYTWPYYHNNNRVESPIKYPPEKRSNFSTKDTLQGPPNVHFSHIFLSATTKWLAPIVPAVWWRISSHFLYFLL